MKFPVCVLRIIEDSDNRGSDNRGSTVPIYMYIHVHVHYTKVYRGGGAFALP